MGVSEASRDDNGKVGSGGKVWEKGEERIVWRGGEGYGLTVGETEILLSVVGYGQPP